IRQFNVETQFQRWQLVVSPSSTLRALVSEDVTLPASLSPAINAQGGTYKGRILQSYKGRTALFLEELASGNVSLRLQDVRASDRGLYRCFVDSGPWNEEVHITLKVEGHFELPFFVFHSLPSLCPGGGVECHTVNAVGRNEGRAANTSEAYKHLHKGNKARCKT
uniref:Immunoglobulin domain-containing protein n=1 Tax=Erpetoichthys calabaricus TaxID=27687 RepID=A0A8C4T6K3_ERPCA